MCSCGRAWRETAPHDTRGRGGAQRREAQGADTPRPTPSRTAHSTRGTRSTRGGFPHTRHSDTQRVTQRDTRVCMERRTHGQSQHQCVSVRLMAQSDAHRHTHDTHTHTRIKGRYDMVWDGMIRRHHHHHHRHTHTHTPRVTHSTHT